MSAVLGRADEAGEVGSFAVRLVAVDLRRLLFPLAVAASVAPAAAQGTWTPINVSQAPPARVNHRAIWTGSSMIVWGGYGSLGSLAGGAVYDPATDGWTPTSTTGAPAARGKHTAVWTGTRMIVWGGWVYSVIHPPDGLALNTALPFGTGGIYDPATDTWTASSTVGAPSPRGWHTAVWTGSKMIVWGGDDLFTCLNTGGIYDPATDTWAPMSTSGAPVPRTSHTAVWTGSKMIVWGGSRPLQHANRHGRRVRPGDEHLDAHEHDGGAGRP